MRPSPAVIASCLCCLLAACASAPVPQPAPPTDTAAADATADATEATAAAAAAANAVAAPDATGEATGERRVQFDCDRGEAIEMRFFPLQGVAVLVRNGQTSELQQQESGSGFIYSNGPTTVRGKGDALTVEIGRMVPLHCTARP